VRTTSGRNPPGRRRTCAASAATAATTPPGGARDQGGTGAGGRRLQQQDQPDHGDRDERRADAVHARARVLASGGGEAVDGRQQEQGDGGQADDQAPAADRGERPADQRAGPADQRDHGEQGPQRAHPRRALQAGDDDAGDQHRHRPRADPLQGPAGQEQREAGGGGGHQRPGCEDDHPHAQRRAQPGHVGDAAEDGRGHRDPQREHGQDPGGAADVQGELAADGGQRHRHGGGPQDREGDERAEQHRGALRRHRGGRCARRRPARGVLRRHPRYTPARATGA